MALEDILATIRKEAKAARKRIREEAKETCASIAERAEREAVEAHDAAVAAEEDRIAREARDVVRAAEGEADRRLRAARERVMRAVLDELEERLASFRDGPRHSEILRRLLNEALAALPSATMIRVDPRDVELVKSMLEGRRLRVEAGSSSWGGVEVADVGGRAVYNTLESRLAAAGADLRRLAAKTNPALRPSTS
jgi:V/A-type H+-transporting ATPase subunit E